MGKELAMAEILKVPLERKKKEDEEKLELSLELSIGGSYGKSNNNPIENGTRSETKNGYGSVDLQKKVDIQDLRRRQEESHKDKLILETQKFESRAVDRESREREGFSENSFRRRKEKNGVIQDLNISLNLPHLNSSMEYDSDYQSTSHKGGSSSDTGSHSSNRRRHRNQLPSTSDNTTRTTLKPETNGTCPNGVANKLPKPPYQSHGGASVQQMPCVSTTGNGPNGKTITGFLCRYTNNEISIICCCHGSSFSPAEFVEHAGGVDISHPLRHITMVPRPLER